MLAELSRPCGRWDAQAWLRCRRMGVEGGRHAVVGRLLRCAQDSTEAALRRLAYEAPPVARCPPRVVDLGLHVRRGATAQWLGYDSVGVPAEAAGAQRAPPPLIICEEGGLDVAARLRGMDGVQEPVIVAAEVTEFTPDGDVDLRRPGSVHPHCLPIRSDLARFVSDACGQARRADGCTASARDHLRSQGGPRLFRCSGVTVFRGSHEHGFQFLDSPFHVDVVAWALPGARPHVQIVAGEGGGDTAWYASKADHAGLIERLNLIALGALQASRERGDRGPPTLVLSSTDLGCGGHPLDAFASALRQWRWRFAWLFHSVYVACGHRGSPGRELAAYLDAIVNKSVYAAAVDVVFATHALDWHWNLHELRMSVAWQELEEAATRLRRCAGRLGCGSSARSSLGSSSSSSSSSSSASASGASSAASSAASSCAPNERLGLAGQRAPTELAPAWPTSAPDGDAGAEALRPPAPVPRTRAAGAEPGARAYRDELRRELGNRLRQLRGPDGLGAAEGSGAGEHEQLPAGQPPDVRAGERHMLSALQRKQALRHELGYGRPWQEVEQEEEWVRSELQRHRALGDARSSARAAISRAAKKRVRPVTPCSTAGSSAPAAAVAETVETLGEEGEEPTGAWVQDCLPGTRLECSGDSLNDAEPSRPEAAPRRGSAAAAHAALRRLSSASRGPHAEAGLRRGSAALLLARRASCRGLAGLPSAQRRASDAAFPQSAGDAATGRRRSSVGAGTRRRSSITASMVHTAVQHAAQRRQSLCSGAAAGDDVDCQADDLAAEAELLAMGAGPRQVRRFSTAAAAAEAGTVATGAAQRPRRASFVQLIGGEDAVTAPARLERQAAAARQPPGAEGCKAEGQLELRRQARARLQRRPSCATAEGVASAAEGAPAAPPRRASLLAGLAEGAREEGSLRALAAQAEGRLQAAAQRRLSVRTTAAGP